MKKTFILDTNILIQTAGDALYGFDDNEVVVTHVTLEELDRKKTDMGEAGWGAREAIRKILALKDSGDYIKGVRIGEGIFRIETNHTHGSLPEGWDKARPDNLIIATAKALSELNDKVYLITNDAAMLIKARVAGVHAESYQNDQIDSEKLYTGRCEIGAFPDDINKIYDNKTIDLPNLPEEDEIYENEFVCLKSGSQSALARYNEGKLHLINPKTRVFGIEPKNQGQSFAMNALMAPAEEIPLVILKGAAGTGKTYCALAAGLEQVYRGCEALYDSIIITRSNTLPENEDLGFLPGSLEEKMGPLLAPFYDNVKSLLRKDSKEDMSQIEMQTQDLMETGILQITSLAYIRGRSIPNSYIIVDEAQNMSRNQIKTLVSRCGIGTKLIIMGDPDQIDTPKLSKKSNGLVYLSEKMKGSKFCAQITFDENECVRSPLAAEAIKLL